MTVMFAVRLHKSEKNVEGKSPVVLQTTFDRKVRRKSTGVWVNEDQFYIDQDKKGRIKNVRDIDEKSKKIQNYLKWSRRILEDEFENTPFDYKEFAKELEKKVNPEKEKVSNTVKVAQFAKKVSEDFIAKGQARSGSDYRYLSNFILTISPNDIEFDQFDINWLKKVEKYYDERGAKGKNTVHRLKLLFGKAVQERHADFRKNPFKNPYTNPYGFDTKRFNRRRISKANPNRLKAIPESKLKQLANYKPTSEKEAEYLDVWWFSYYCFGTNMTDIAPLKKQHIKDGRWFYSRSKSNVSLKLGKPLSEKALEIIERWGNKNPDSVYVFPILINGYDKTPESRAKRERDYVGYIRKMAVRVSKKLGWDDYFTFYSARHTSLTIALNKGIDRNTVSHLADHSNLSTLDHYAGLANDKNIVEAVDILNL